jgi:hypothetical protein
MTSSKRRARIAGMLYLLVIGVRTVKIIKPDERVLATAGTLPHTDGGGSTPGQLLSY